MLPKNLSTDSASSSDFEIAVYNAYDRFETIQTKPVNNIWKSFNLTIMVFIFYQSSSKYTI